MRSISPAASGRASTEEAVAAGGSPGAARILYYSHDTYGLGHLRRTLTLARFLREGRPQLSQLLVTGSPLAHRFQLPAGADYVKLPSVVKVGAGQYESRDLSLPFASVRDLRRQLVLDVARHFEPQALVVDNVPAGLKGELVPTLEHLKQSGCRLVLGLRDVIDEREAVRESWERDGSYELLDDLYDRILVYGRRDIYDVVAEYGFPDGAAAKTRFVGYLRREGGRRRPDEVRAELGLDGGPLALVMAGGGGDGYQLLASVLDALRLRPGKPLDCLLLGGPLMPAEDRRRVQRFVAEQPSVRYRDFVDDVASYIGAADVVVAMGGYNSVCELLSARKPALVVPRVQPRREQLIRAQALSRRGALRMMHPDRLTPEGLRWEIERLLAEPNTPAALELGGLPAAAAELDELLGAPAGGLAATGA